ncbi:FAD-dependent oxidoreductase [Hephaestia sp. GCM10023244]|uniref:FAD-dependent oxidoreductase n=1 Tax=unclassified Hephaestia TaxID=2631281 RepID=UPI0020773317|nr:FAD-dependent oxidoreductase [Hephaestia sp. MAHUQ-44]MCM8730897.1 FAD-dependent oxidoreductase [Hephaestia sp. MAHUQ-44]
MGHDSSAPTGPDFTQGIPLAEIADGGMVAGHVGGEAALLIARGDDLFAVAATCTHYGGPLAEGLLVGETIRCPWHHACFNLRTGHPHAPALDALKRWRVETRDGTAFVREELPEHRPSALADTALPASIVVVGGGAAGNAAIETLRREGYQGPITLISADAALPCDRPNLSKDYLAGSAAPEWIPLRSADFYAEQRIDVRLACRVTAIDPGRNRLTLDDGSTLDYGALLLATGASPVRLTIPGADLPHVHVLRTLADADALIAGLDGATRCVIVGASFIGLEAAAALSTRGIEVHVVAPDKRPMERVLGAAIGDAVKALHEAHGVVFHLETTLTAIHPDRVTLSTGTDLAADLVVTGIGVRPDIALAEAAGLATDRGVSVDAFLTTSAPGIYAAGDIARWPDARTGDNIRVEHWAVAERQGATAARNMLGRHERFAAVPFFWSQHYDTTINYAGHAEGWDRIEIDGDPAAHDCTVTYWQSGTRRAVATIGRDIASLDAEAAFEKEVSA